MKRMLLLPLILMLIIYSASAQVEVGVKFGGSHNSIVFTNTPYISGVTTKRYGCFGGVTSLVPISEKIYIKPELLLLARGWKELYDDNESANIDIEYLSFPLSVGYKLSKNISVLAGAESNYLIEANDKGTSRIDIKDEKFNRLEFGLHGALAYQFLDNFVLEARYSRGITKLITWSGGTDDGWNEDTHYNGGLNRAFQLSLAYQVKSK